MVASAYQRRQGIFHQLKPDDASLPGSTPQVGFIRFAALECYGTRAGPRSVAIRLLRKKLLRRRIDPLVKPGGDARSCRRNQNRLTTRPPSSAAGCGQRRALGLAAPRPRTEQVHELSNGAQIFQVSDR